MRSEGQSPHVDPAPPPLPDAGAPASDASPELTTAAAAASPGSLTPMMKQYLETKAAHPDAILFFRLGDFYEMFFEDAVRAAEILQIALTSRSKGSDRVPMCGVPYHSARRYIARLIEAGLKVAICDQVEEPTGQGIVRREVTRVVTPGMALDEELLQSRTNNFLAAVALGEERLGAALIDASTGEFFCFEADGPQQLAQELSRYEPKELLADDADASRAALKAIADQLPVRPALATLERAAFEPARAAAYLKSHFQVLSLDGFGLTHALRAVGAAGAALRYLKDTQRTAGAHVDRVTLVHAGSHLVLDETTRTNLELVKSLKDGTRKGALVGVLDRSVTGMGARKLARWLLSPLRALPEIALRHDAVGELVHDAGARDALTSLLGEVGDLERLCGRLCLGAGNARDLRQLGRSLAQLPHIARVLGGCKSALLKALASPLTGPVSLGELLLRAVAEEPPATLKEGGLIRAGFNAQLDELVALSTSGRDFLLKLELRERERTQIGSLKVRYNKVFGYYLEVTKANLHLVPPDYLRKQTTVGAERFVTPELKEYEEKVVTAEERRCALEYQLFEQLRSQVVAAAAEIRAAAEAIGTCDALASFARCAAEYGYVRPELDESEELEIVGGRHPVVERLMANEPFVPNDVSLGVGGARLCVITGPNMAGKSTVMRQVALAVLMAQAGSFVPARRARIGLCDRVFTRVGASDNLAKGQSTFMVEMTETANILHHATAKSLVILDEIGRGTSTFDGLSIAWAVAEHLHDHASPRALFATHYHELTELARTKPHVRNCQVAVREQGGRVIFLRKLVPGGASRSYGIEVARLAGLPAEVIERARVVLRGLEASKLSVGELPRVPCADQLPLFAGEPGPAGPLPTHPVVQRLLGVDLNQTTPVKALLLLAELQAEVGRLETT